MGIGKRLFIYATFIWSCGAIALTITAFATTSWLVSEMRVADSSSTDENDLINYGLFSGTLERHLLATPMIVDVFITCIDNSCVWSCNPDADERVDELEQLIATGTVTNLKGCSSSRKSSVSFLETMWEEQDSLERGYGRDGEFEERDGSVRKEVDQQFLNAGVRISTIVFLALALAFAVTGAVFAVINSAINPIELITGIVGLYIWNGVAAICDIIVLCLWGGHFAGTLTNNVAYTEVIMGDLISKDLAGLGYSYWCVLGAMVLHMVNIVLLGIRQMLLSREPEPSTIRVEENNDGAIFLY